MKSLAETLFWGFVVAVILIIAAILQDSRVTPTPVPLTTTLVPCSSTTTLDLPPDAEDKPQDPPLVICAAPMPEQINMDPNSRHGL